VLVFAFVYLLFDRTAIAAITALVFALHPLHVESVAWISGRTDVLSTLWAMAALCLYVQFRRLGHWALLAGTLVAFLLSLFAKESSAFVPLVAVVLEVPPLRALTTRGMRRHNEGWRAPTAIAAMFVVLAVYFALRNHVLGTPFSSYPGYAPGALGTIALPLSVFAGYVYKALAPLRLSAEWDAPVPESFADAHVIGGLLLAIGIVAALVRFRRNPAVVLGIAVFVLGVAPVVNIIPIGEISAERFLYFPLLGFALVLGAVFEPAVSARARGRSQGRELLWVLAVLLVAYAVRTVTRTPVWANEKVLFTATVEDSPDVPRAWVNLGDVARREGRIDDTIRLYKRSIDIDPDYTLGLSNLAGVYVQQGRLDDAAPLIERAVRAEPNNAGLLANLGSLYFEQGKLDQAVGPLERAVAIQPEHPTANFNLGLIKFRQRRLQAARVNFEQVAGLGPPYDMANYYLAVIAEQAGEAAVARRHAERFLQTHAKSDEYSQRARAIIQRTR
jgi:tetratricopeptide (TPR) repeat protein